MKLKYLRKVLTSVENIKNLLEESKVDHYDMGSCAYIICRQVTFSFEINHIKYEIHWESDDKNLKLTSDNFAFYFNDFYIIQSKRRKEFCFENNTCYGNITQMIILIEEKE